MAYTAETLLEDVKKAIGVTGIYQNDTIQAHIDEVKEYLTDAGVHVTVLNSKKAKGVIARGVTDLWNYGAGDGKLSPYFYERATQLVYAGKIEEVEEDGEI